MFTRADIFAISTYEWISEKAAVRIKPIFCAFSWYRTSVVIIRMVFKYLKNLNDFQLNEIFFIILTMRFITCIIFIALFNLFNFQESFGWKHSADTFTKLNIPENRF